MTVRAAALPLTLLLVTAVPAVAQVDELRGVGHSLGAENAPVVVIEFLDFGCAACAQFAHSSFPLIRDEYVDPGRVRWIAVPFVLGAFRNSEQAARAATCAARQGKFWAIHDTLFQDRRWSKVRKPDAILLELARAAGADSSSFQACYQDRATTRIVQEARRVALELRVEGTPTFFI